MSTDRIPGLIAAEGIHVAHLIAAGEVAAGRSSIRGAAVAGVGIAALRSRTRVHGAGAIGGAPGQIRAREVPILVAAEDVDRAHCVAAVFIVALRGAVGGAAISGAGVPAVPVRAAATAGALAGELDARLIPGRIAAEGVGCTDIGATSLVVAAGRFVGDATVPGREVAALRRVAVGNGRFGADTVPDDFAADRIREADVGAALTVAAAR